MPTKKNKRSAPIMLVPQKSDPMDRLAVVAERLVMVLFERDRAAQDREQKLREKAIEILQQIAEKKPGFDYSEMLQGFVKEASNALTKIIDLKKLEAMTPRERFKTASRRA